MADVIQTPENQTPTQTPSSSNTPTDPAATNSQVTNPPSTSPASSDPATPPVDPAAPPATDPAVPPVDPATPPATDPAAPPATDPATPPAEVQDYEIEVAETSPLTDQDLQVIADYASKYGLTKAEAQDMVTAQEALYLRGHKTSQDAHTAQITKMKNELNSHPMFSGEQSKASWQYVAKAVDTFGNDQIREVLGQEKFGYDVNLALFLRDIGQALMPEAHIPGSGTSTAGQAQVDPERAKLERAYPGMFKNK